jgi:hypothetical protein
MSDHLFEPDALIPAQYFATFRPEGGLERERMLLLAVLADALECYKRYAHTRDPRGQQVFEETDEWLRSTDRSSLFAFESVCDALGIEADYLRRGLRQWREQRQVAVRSKAEPDVPRHLLRAAGSRPHGRSRPVTQTRAVAGRGRR